MSIGAGLDAQIGIVVESVVNTPAAVTTFTEFDSETLEARPTFVQGLGLRAGGLVGRSVRRILTSLDGGGTVTFAIPTKGLGKWMQMCMGSSPTATQISTTGTFTQFHNVGSADGTTYTIQKGVPSINGTVNPVTFSGCKATDWTVTSAPNAIATLVITVDAMNVQPTGAGALGIQTASYAAANPLFAFQQLTVQTFAAMTVVSSLWTPTSPTLLVDVRNFTLKGGQPKDVTRWVAGSLTKAEALVNDFQPITGTVDIDFQSMALYNSFVANTTIGIQATFTGAIIGTSGSNMATLQFTMPACFLEAGSTPKVSNAGIVTVSYPFTALDDGTNGALQVYIISTDSVV